MDTFAHFAWSVALFYRYRWRWWAGLVGVLPDLLSFGLYMVLNIGKLFSQQGPPAIASLPAWLFFMYGLTHSIVVFAATFGIVWAVRKKPPIILLAWLGHIVIDVFTHTTAYFPTPALWPLSTRVYAHGISWATLPFMIINYAALAAVWLLIATHAFQGEWQRWKEARATKYKKRLSP